MRVFPITAPVLLVVTVLACSGAAPEALFGGDASAAAHNGVDASAPGPVTADGGADAAVSGDAAAALDAFAVTCVPRDNVEAGAPCLGSYQCPIGALCCGADGQSNGQASGTCSNGPCGNATPIQLCTATCECLQGACNNAWPYQVHGSCR